MKSDSPLAPQAGDNNFSSWFRWAQRRGYPIWTVPVGFFAFTAGLFGLAMLCLFLFLPKGNVPTLTAGIEKLPGVSSAKITSNGDRYRTFQETVTVQLKPDATVTDPKALVRYLFQVAWAAKGGEPEQTSVRVEGAASVNVFIAAVEDGWNEATGGGRTVEVDGSYLGATFGAYPGKAPIAPSGMLSVSS